MVRIQVMLGGVLSMVKEAQLVTVLHSPVASTQYVPLLAACTLLRTRQLPDWPSNSVPFFLQTKENVPLAMLGVPEGVVQNVTVAPGQTLWLVKAVATVGKLLVKAAWQPSETSPKESLICRK